jgi:tRNA-dihydrouridine synthase
MINLGFWKKLNKPIMVLAPMADVTDAAFRRIIANYGKPDVMWTEFVSADGLALAPEEGRKKLLRDLEYSESERPIVAQFFTAKPYHMKKAAELAQQLGFDGIDINMGCPAGPIENQGAGAALIKNPKLARELIRAAKAGAGSLPVSVKTRTGFNKIELETWLPELLVEEPAVITVHARTRKEMSKVPANWDLVKKAVEIRDSLKSQTLIFGNGDVKDLDDARKKAVDSGADGVMLGRAIFGNPWLFESLGNNTPPAPHFTRGSAPLEGEITRSLSQRTRPDNLSPLEGSSSEQSEERGVFISEKLVVMLEHTKLFVELLGDIKSFAIMKKHYKAYVNGFPGAPELRGRLMEAENYEQIEKLVRDFQNTA